VGRGLLGHIDTVALGWTGQAVDVRLAGTLPDLGDLAGRLGCTSPLTAVASCSELAVLRRGGWFEALHSESLAPRAGGYQKHN
jgi:hypothetical protein